MKRSIFLFIFLKCFHCWKDGKIFQEESDYIKKLTRYRRETNTTVNRCKNDHFYCPEPIGNWVGIFATWMNEKEIEFSKNKMI